LAGGIEASRQYKESGSTPLEIVHDPNDSQCDQRRKLAQGMLDEQLRVKVRNTGRFDLNGVRARLDTEGGHAHWLRIRHDNEPPFHRSLEGEMLPADGSYWVYFDVAFSSVGQGWDGFMQLEYADEYLRKESASRERQRIVVVKVWASREVDGRSVPPAERRFSLRMLDDAPHLRLTEIAEP
jgi:hypothetical protein